MPDEIKVDGYKINNTFDKDLAKLHEEYSYCGDLKEERRQIMENDLREQAVNMVQEVRQIPQGWECPKCGRVYAPHVDMCQFCGDYSNVTVTTSNPNPIVLDGSDPTIVFCNYAQGGSVAP
jgi:hypothetical protein